MTIDLKDISLVYPGNVKAISHITFRLQSGMVGLLGPNGAGKSTLMRVLVSLLRPTGGSLQVDGVRLTGKTAPGYKARIGYMPQELGFHPNLTVAETLHYYGILQKLDKPQRNKRIGELLTATNLAAHAGKKIRQLSGGMKRRVGLAQALLNNPDFLLVDEPTAGLDPEERIRIRQLLSSFSENRIVLMSTHIVEDIASTCRDVLILEKGLLAFEGTVQQLMESARGHVFTQTVQGGQALMDVQAGHLVTNTIYTSGGIGVRMVSAAPVPGALAEEPNMEDAYFYARHCLGKAGPVQ